jgi:hypothetical protein
LDKPLVLIAYLGFPIYNVTRANTLISVEIAAMAKLCRDWGFRVAVAKTMPEDPESKIPLTGVELWDGETQPEVLWLHQALPNIPGGVREMHDHALGVLRNILPGVKKICRLVVDNNESMSHSKLMATLKDKGESCYYLSGYKQRGPNEGYRSLHKAIENHVTSGTFWEIGYDAARSKNPSLNFKSCPVFTEQLLLARGLFAPEEKTLDFCYIGASRSNETKRKARLRSIGEELLNHENSFYGGTLFKKRSSIRFPKAWRIMSSSKAHLITRDPGMDQLPLHRYMQALVHEAIPVVLNESDPVAFIRGEELQNILRVKNYEEALRLVDNYQTILPLLRDELRYWADHDTSTPCPL